MLTEVFLDVNIFSADVHDFERDLFRVGAFDLKCDESFLLEVPRYGTVGGEVAAAAGEL